MPSEQENIDALRECWKHLYKSHLPALAKAKDPLQKHWPVYLDHCFARIILDNAVGRDRPWTEVVQQPAIKNMSPDQLEASITLGERIATGQEGLDALNERSLKFRGKKRKAETVEHSASPKKRKQGAPTISSYFLPSPSSPRKDDGSQEGVTSLQEAQKARQSSAPMSDATSGQQKLVAGDDEHHEDMSPHLRRIADSNLTPFRKQMLTLLCEIPRGRYSTYQTMSDYVSRTSHKTCARAVGNAMRNNPFAPEVPCHRVLAHDGSLGGFGGHWGENGKFASKKHELLYGEGVRFDSKGKVKGPPFRDFRG